MYIISQLKKVQLLAVVGVGVETYEKQIERPKNSCGTAIPLTIIVKGTWTLTRTGTRTLTWTTQKN
jgi:hypothetical protein